MKIGLSIDSYKGIEPSVILGVARKLGLEHVELTRVVFAEAEAVARQVRGMSAGFHLPVLELDGFDFSCPEAQAQIDAVIRDLNTHWRALNVRYCVAHPPEPGAAKEAVDTCDETLLDNLARLEPPILLENVPTSNKREFHGFYRRAKGRLGERLHGICFDAAHGYLSGEDIHAWFGELDGEVACVHLSDCSAEADLHLPFNSGGVLPIQEFLQRLESSGYHGTINLELAPRSLYDLEPILNSYLTVLRRFDRRKYWRVQARMAFVRPVLRMLLSQ